MMILLILRLLFLLLPDQVFPPFGGKASEQHQDASGNICFVSFALPSSPGSFVLLLDRCGQLIIIEKNKKKRARS